MTIKKKKIAYVSGTRADFGIISSILKSVDQSPKLNLQLYVTGIHLMPKFGATHREVQKIFPHTQTIPHTFISDNLASQAKFMGQFLTKITKVFVKQRPDFVLVLGDRPEELGVAITCLYLGIPTGHFRGGEVSSTFDEVARHAITKLCSLHFPATQDAVKRIIKMGEEKWRIHRVGEASLDVILNEKLPNQKEVFKFLNLETKKKFILLTQHPVSYELKEAGHQMRETLEAVKELNLPVVVTYPHADAGSRMMIKEIEQERKNPLFKIFSSIDYKLFLALERETAIWIGNSSGALVESSSFGTPVVNIGTRQKGRQRGDNVMDTTYDRKKIVSAIKKSWKPKYLAHLKTLKNPWGDGQTGPRVTKILEELDLSNPELIKKQITY